MPWTYIVFIGQIKINLFENRSILKPFSVIASICSPLCGGWQWCGTTCKSWFFPVSMWFRSWNSGHRWQQEPSPMSHLITQGVCFYHLGVWFPPGSCYHCHYPLTESHCHLRNCSLLPLGGEGFLIWKVAHFHGHWMLVLSRSLRVHALLPSSRSSPCQDKFLLSCLLIFCPLGSSLTVYQLQPTTERHF